MKTGTVGGLTPLTTKRRLPDKRLLFYGLSTTAALASGVSQANASPVTLDLTGLPTADRTTFFGLGGNVFFDVNAANAAAAVQHTGFAAADFRLFNNAFGTPSANVKTAGIAGYNNAANQVAVSNGQGHTLQRFVASNFVDPMSSFRQQRVIARQVADFQNNTTFTSGPFAPGDTGYIGLRFDIAGNVHFGWANLTLNQDFTLTLNAVGYESNPNTLAHVEPFGATNGVPEGGSSLALLAIGAAGLLAFRARQSKAA